MHAGEEPSFPPFPTLNGRETERRAAVCLNGLASSRGALRGRRVFAPVHPMAPSQSSEVERLRAELALVKAKQGSLSGPADNGFGMGKGEGRWRVDAAVLGASSSAGRGGAHRLGSGEETSNPALERELQSLRTLGNQLRSFPEKMAREEGSFRSPLQKKKEEMDRRLKAIRGTLQTLHRDDVASNHEAKDDVEGVSPVKNDSEPASHSSRDQRRSEQPWGGTVEIESEQEPMDDSDKAEQNRHEMQQELARLQKQLQTMQPDHRAPAAAVAADSANRLALGGDRDQNGPGSTAAGGLGQVQHAPAVMQGISVPQSNQRRMLVRPTAVDDEEDFLAKSKRLCITGKIKANRGLRTVANYRRQRFKDDDFNLDLSFISPRIIAMARPAQDFPGSLIRDDLHDVCEWVRKHQSGKAKIYDIAGETRLNDESARLLQEAGATLSCGALLMKERSVPTIDSLHSVVKDMLEWLNEDPMHNVIVSCKSGKSRTGVLISCLLLALAIANDETEAVDKFTEKRVRMGEALKIPSYRRWVSYFSQRHAPLRGVHDPVRLSRVEFCEKALVDPRNFFLRTINQSPILFKAKVRILSELDGASGETGQVFSSKWVKANQAGIYSFDIGTPDEPVLLLNEFRLVVDCQLPTDNLEAEGPSCWLHSQFVPHNAYLDGPDFDFPRHMGGRLNPNTRGGANEADWGMQLTIGGNETLVGSSRDEARDGRRLPCI